MNNRRIIFLDYMRVIAFSLVILGHKFNSDLYSLANDANNHVTLRFLYGALADASFGGAMGVVVFFLVSGYIITHVLQSESPLEFYIKRAFRIYPLYIFAVIAESLTNYNSGFGIPPISILIPRLLLVGDFFDTPLSLANVEWTLRVEVLFYLFMGVVKFAGLTNKGNVLSVILVFVVMLLSISQPFPMANDFHNAYFTLYVPFLFIGVIIYLLEKQHASTSVALTSIIIIFYLHLHLIERYAPSWGKYNYAFIGLAIFLISWKFRTDFSESSICKLLSDLTYSVYLFHNWIWVHLSSVVENFGITRINTNIQILVLLFGVCYITTKTIEKGGILAGKKVLKYINKK